MQAEMFSQHLTRALQNSKTTLGATFNVAVKSILSFNNTIIKRKFRATSLPEKLLCTLACGQLYKLGEIAIGNNKV